jgi:pimeloyl-ACP methyl ester carboxylesterase
MKDRAGVIGTRSVGPLLRDLLGKASETTFFHLVGHSYGARVHLNALSRPEGGPLPRAVDSLLLLQPAVNHLCFAEMLDTGTSGGYRAALAMVKHPVLTTFSHHDFPLHDTFHLSLRRGKDVGEIGIAGDEPPSKYAALGGYGPRGLAEWEEVDVKTCPDPYDLGPEAPEVWAVKGGDLIMGHGDVVSPATAWALFNLVKG